MLGFAQLHKIGLHIIILACDDGRGTGAWAWPCGSHRSCSFIFLTASVEIRETQNKKNRTPTGFRLVVHLSGSKSFEQSCYWFWFSCHFGRKRKGNRQLFCMDRVAAELISTFVKHVFAVNKKKTETRTNENLLDSQRNFHRTPFVFFSVCNICSIWFDGCCWLWLMQPTNCTLLFTTSRRPRHITPITTFT